MKRISTVLQTVEEANNILVQLFVSDSDTTIVDNSANCIVWKHCKDFIDATHIKIPPDLGIAVNTVHGKGMPVVIGTIQVGWHDDYGKYHNFEFPDGYHMPNSCINALGVAKFSQILGDYQRKGTQINLSRRALF